MPTQRRKNVEVERYTIAEERRPAIETLDQQLHRVESEFKELQFLKLKREYSDYPEDNGDIRVVSGIKGPLAYTEISIEGTQVEAMLDAGSSVCIISQELFLKVGKAPGINALQQPDIPLRDYSQNTISVIASVNLKIGARGNTITETMYNLPGAEPSCLLGLSMVCQLGLVCLAPEVKMHQEDSDEANAEKGGKSQAAVVQLIKVE